MDNSQKRNRLILPLIAGIAAILGLLTSYYYRGNTNDKSYQSLLMLPEAKPISDFELIDYRNNKVNLESVKGNWTLIFFGYTHCPDICPTTLTELKKVFKLLGDSPKPDVLFVSVDPERDDRQTLKDYITFFNKNFNAATSDKQEIHKLAAEIGVAYYIEEHQPGEMNYTVDHTAAIFLMNPKGQLQGLFRSPHEAAKITADLKLLLN